MHLPFGLSIDDVLTVSTAFEALLVLFLVWHALLVRDPLATRVKALAERRDVLRAGLRTKVGNRTRSDLRESGLTIIGQLVRRLNLVKGRQVERFGARLARAGWRNKDAINIYIFAKLALPFILGGIAILAVGVLKVGPLNPGMRLLILCGGFMAGIYSPDIYLKNATDKRIQKMRKGLPDALDLLVICAEAGLSLDASITRVGREMVNAAPELADEFSLTALELGFLPNRQTALQNLTERTGMQEIRSLVNSLMQTERYGTPLTQSLRVLANEFRDDRLMRAEEKAAKLPATMTVPMIVFILPALFIVIGGPAAIRTMDTFAKM